MNASSSAEKTKDKVSSYVIIFSLQFYYILQINRIEADPVEKTAHVNHTTRKTVDKALS